MLFRYVIAGVIGAGFGIGAGALTPAQAQSAPHPSIVDLPLSAAELSGLAPVLNHIGEAGNHIHIHPTVQGHQARVKYGLTGQATSTNLTYHKGTIMNPKVTTGPQTNMQIYTIFWLPASGKLQDGKTATTMAGNYQSVVNNMAQGLITSHIAGVATQYYQTTKTQTYVNQGGLAGTYVDTAAYPATIKKSCNDTATPGNCITDAQLQAELTRVMGVNGWTPGPNKIYMMMTSSGEGSCATSTQCSYTTYCAYHSNYTATVSGATGSVIYANMPYGNTSACQSSGQATPNAVINGVNYGPYADLVANVATHEIIEAITDPLGNAWYDSSGNEIGDKCAWNFGSNVYSNPASNEYFASNPYPSPVFLTGYTPTYFETQQEWSNGANAAGQTGCVQYYYNF